MKTWAAGFLLWAGVAGAATPETGLNSTWNSKSAAAYLDSRMTWWSTWSTAARDEGTFCVSCHTAVPYALSRATLRSSLGETAPSATEQKLVENVTKRVNMWAQMKPFYPDNPKDAHKTVESRGTESILSALVLTANGAPASKQALENMWAEQITTEGPNKGSFEWLQFHNSPWEGDSQYYGATLAAIAAGKGDANPAKMDLLRAYLIRERDEQVLANKVVLLWAAAKTPGLLTAEQRKSIVEEALSKQQEDGGISLSSLVGDWKRRDKTALEAKSDGYATGLVAFSLQQAGVSRSDKRMEKALAWLAQNQDSTDGRWLAYSLNKQRDLSTDVGKFMSDAATAYAVMALQTNGK